VAKIAQTLIAETPIAAIKHRAVMVSSPEVISAASPMVSHPEIRASNRVPAANLIMALIMAPIMALIMAAKKAVNLAGKTFKSAALRVNH
jgi:Ca2+/Na+ antiporter